jgi:SagB-type dehydrogenase family enzyme
MTILREKRDAIASCLLSIIVLAVWLLATSCPAAAQPVSPAVNEIALPAPHTTGRISVEQALATRRSIRQFASKDLTLEQIGQLAWAAQGITDPQTGHRTAPSAVAMYPLTIYLFTKDGVFRYLPQGHKLLQVFAEDKRGVLAATSAFGPNSSGQPSVRNAPLVMVICANAGKMLRFAANAEKWIDIEAGHAGENVHLQAVAMGLGSVTVGGINPAEAIKVLGSPANEAVIYAIPIGYAAAAPAVPERPRVHVE